MAKSDTISLFSGSIIRPAIASAFVKLDPRVQLRNPVMFVVEVVAALNTLRRSRTETDAKLLSPDGLTTFELVPATSLKVGDLVLVEAGDLIPSDGEVIEGVASVNESAITGESAPVIREAGGDRSAVTGGTQVISDWLKVRITTKPGETFVDRMIALIEGAKRQKTPNEIALSILLSGLTLVFLIAVVTLYGLAAYSGTVLTVT